MKGKKTHIREIIRHISRRVISAQTIQNINDATGDIIQENEIDGCFGGGCAVGRETTVCLEEIGVGVVSYFLVDGVVAVGAEVVGGGVAWGCGCAAGDAAAGVAAFGEVVVGDGGVDAAVEGGVHLCEGEGAGGEGAFGGVVAGD